MTTTTRTIALRIPGHHMIYAANSLELAKADAARHSSEGRKVTLKWHTETVTAETSTSPAHGTCTSCGGVVVVDCAMACDCGWEIGHCNTKTGEIYGMSSAGASLAARETLDAMINGEDSYEALCAF